MRTETLKKNWILSPDAFQHLLVWLDEGRDSEGRRYLEIRSRLVSYFDRKNCQNADELADETLNRVARRLLEEGKIESETPAKFCYATAKFVFLESLRDKEKQAVQLDEVLYREKIDDLSETAELAEKRMACLENCARSLSETEREIIFGYYFGEERAKIENRRAIANKFSLSSNALAVKACRLRESLRVCVKNCVEKS